MFTNPFYVYKKVLKKCFHKFSFQLFPKKKKTKKDHVPSQNISLKYILLLNAEDNNFQNKPNPTN